MSEKDISDRVQILDTEVLADDWAVLKKTTLRWRRRDGSEQTFTRETYDRGNGAVLLPYNRRARSVLLTRQFRYPPFAMGHHRMLLEAPAGLLDSARPEARIREEVEEETGYRLRDVRRAFDMFMSPGSVTETLHFFIGEYDASMRVGDGGGNEDEGEDIEVVELPLDDALAMVGNGGIVDAKTALLLYHVKLHVFGGDAR